MTAAQVPRLLLKPHDRQSSVQAESQHTPSAQKPVAQSDGAEHDAARGAPAACPASAPASSSPMATAVRSPTPFMSDRRPASTDPTSDAPTRPASGTSKFATPSASHADNPTMLKTTTTTFAKDF